MPWAHLGMGSNSTWKNTQPKVEPNSATGNRCTEAFEAWINAFSHKERESKIHVEPSHTANEKETGLLGWGEAKQQGRRHLSIELFLLMQ